MASLVELALLFNALQNSEIPQPEIISYCQTVTDSEIVVSFPDSNFVWDPRGMSKTVHRFRRGTKIIDVYNYLISLSKGHKWIPYFIGTDDGLTLRDLNLWTPS